MEIFIEVDKKKELLLSIGISNEAKVKLNDKFRLEWSFHSNHMEGNTLTYGETQMLLFFGKAIGDHEKRDFDEMEAHDVAVAMVEQWARDSNRDLTEGDIRQLNKIILVKSFWKDSITNSGEPSRKEIIPGQYKLLPNSVRLSNNQIHQYAPPSETPFLMTELVERYQNSIKAQEHPILTAAWFHHRFVSIHPFDDGNGRVARLLTNFILLRNNYPPVVIKSEHKDEYLTMLQKADVGDIEPFIHFLIKELNWSLDISIKAANGQSIDELGDLDKQIEFIKRQLTKKDVASRAKDAAVMNEIFEKSISPLLQSVEKRCQKLQDLFLDFNRSIQCNVGGVAEVFAGKEASWRDIEFNWKHISESRDMKSLYTIEYEYQFKGFKKSLTHQYMTTRLQFQFNEFSYNVRVNGDYNSTLLYSYDSELTEDEIQRIVKLVIAEVLRQISDAGGIKKN